MVNRKKLNPDGSPQERFGVRVRRLREARKWTQDELAARMGYSGRHISAIETANKPPTLPVARALDIAFGLEGTLDTFERQWNEIENGALVEGFPEYVGKEATAAEIRLFDVGLVPGPLQTSEYAAAVEAGNVKRGSITAEQATERVDYLIRRQAALVRPLPPMMIAVLDESCIRHCIGGLEVMERQLARLIEFAEQPNTSLHIAPFVMGELRPFNRSVNLLTLADRSVVAYVESQARGYLDREITSVAPLMRAYHQLQTEALSQAESVAVINQVRKGTS
ncbi:helix-turn-helix domain-containing protein [Streptomyces clavuligerus]|uniref:helix-turn-helix domain-containing protein n=1 Tax=Streptomyces clavuligerus TaxID=1901 RepID=UPI00018006D3|nr:helix-turn-helix transcriptional regulator [Streptomyces clavuligerus]ANW21873.1 transcriptional regulator [Streptomyces clavuligerus]AXU16507.1 XRE family transcriptional regulator [Streptomyces clavuligerus]EDY52915.1 transcriptional regulator [Streptomyces clavuligerus]MBY6303030.1 helix-turn-helix transcriptional regulator [Streptomyces clavuligerus]QCS09269.1 XRE family transcriptional regulator [Streptomyces clavuligerus]